MQFYPQFFSHHTEVGGHVAHAAKIIGSIVKNGFNTTVVAEENYDIFNFDRIEIMPQHTFQFCSIVVN